jgi:hypothetical protein
MPLVNPKPPRSSIRPRTRPFGGETRMEQTWKIILSQCNSLPRQYVLKNALKDVLGLERGLNSLLRPMVLYPTPPLILNLARNWRLYGGLQISRV